MDQVTLGVVVLVAVIGGMALSTYSLYSRTMYYRGQADAYEEIAEQLKRLSDEK